jgi:hypothetical protein
MQYLAFAFKINTVGLQQYLITVQLRAFPSHLTRSNMPIAYLELFCGKINCSIYIYVYILILSLDIL